MFSGWSLVICLPLNHQTKENIGFLVSQEELNKPKSKQLKTPLELQSITHGEIGKTFVDNTVCCRINREMRCRSQQLVQE